MDAQQTSEPNTQPVPEIISPAVRDFLNSYAQEERFVNQRENTANIQVSRAAATLATIYERIRQAIDYQEEQVLRRRAIARILLRLLTSSKMTERSLAEVLIKEVTWARYLQDNTLPPERIDEVAAIIKRYKILLEHNTYKQTKKLPDLRDWILGVMSTEIEQLLVPHLTIDALVQLMYKSLDHSQGAFDIDEATKNLQIYLTIQRTVVKADNAALRFLLLNSYYPDWPKNNSEVTHQVSAQLIQAVEAIEYHIHHPLGDRLLPIIRKQAAPFLILKAVADEHKKKRKEVLAVISEREIAVKDICTKKYKNIRQRVQRAATRSIIYLFITKMTLAFIVEVPLDKLIYKEVHLMPLAINVLFPPVLMFIVALTIRTPGVRNTERIIHRLNAIIDDEDGLNSVKLTLPQARRRSAAYLYLYVTTFVISFGIIWLVLSKLHFNFVSKGLFFLFTCLVSFFAFRIRQTSREFLFIEDKDSLFASLIDFFFLPFLRVGRWLSQGFSKINVFIFLFDFILEAPLKSLISVAEEWFSFIREKKDELV